MAKKDVSIDNSNVLDLMNDQLSKFLVGKIDKISVEENIPLVPTKIKVLDLLLGGGIGSTTFTVLVGNPGTFKSTIASQILKSFIEHHEKTTGIYIDTERIMTKERLESLGVKNLKPLSGFTVEKVVSLLQSFTVFKDTKKLKEFPSIVIWDSIANTPVEAELLTDNVNSVIGLKARLLSFYFPQIVELMGKYNIGIVAINQFRDKINMGMFSSPNELKHMQHDKTMPGGNAIMFNASQLLQLKTKSSYDYTTSPYGFRAAIVNVLTVKNKFFPDNNSVDLVINVAKGVSDLYSSFELMKKHKLIVAGSWHYLTNFPEKKFRVKELESVYNSDPKFKEVFDSEIDALIENLHNKFSSYQNDMSIDDETIEVDDNKIENIEQNVMTISDLSNNEEKFIQETNE